MINESGPMTDLLNDLAPIDAFPTVDEMHAFARGLAEAHPDRVTLRDVGASRAGEAIQLVTLAAAAPETEVLIIGQPHPNEPIGMATIKVLCEALLADGASGLDASRASWHFLPAVDPDGTRLNEGWFAGPWTREHYARHFFRPGSEAQVEWTFPFSSGDFSVDAPMPETRALMAAIDLVKPSVVASLHNGEMGGAYYYVSEGDEALFAQLGQICTEHGIPLHLGEPEIPVSALLAPAVFSVPRTQDIFDFASMVGMEPGDVISGASSYDYAIRHGAVAALVIELPYWRDPRADDTSPSPSGLSRREVKLASLDLEDECIAFLQEIAAEAAPLPESLISDAVTSFLGTFVAGFAEMKRQQAQNDPEFELPVTVAEEFSAYDEIDMFRLRIGGMLLRVLPEGATRDRMEATFTQWCADTAGSSKAEAVPIRDLVAVQGKAILATLETALRNATA